MHVIKCKMQVRILHALYLNHLQQLQCLQYYRLGYHSQCQQLLFCYFIIASLSLSISIETWSTPQPHVPSLESLLFLSLMGIVILCVLFSYYVYCYICYGMDIYCLLSYFSVFLVTPAASFLIQRMNIVMRVRNSIFNSTYF